MVVVVVVVVIFIVLFFVKTELIEAAFSRAIGKIVRGFEDGPASICCCRRRRRRRRIIRNVIFVVDRAKLHPRASRD